MDIDTLKAGPELDRLIAERVMGWHRGKGSAILTPSTETPDNWYNEHGKKQAHVYSDDFACRVAWSPSMNIIAAWEVLDVFRDFSIRQSTPTKQVVLQPTSLYPGVSAEAETVPLAICRAALKAVLATQQTTARPPR